MSNTDYSMQKDVNGNKSPIILIENLCKNFGKLEVLKGINLTVPQGCKMVIIGPSGSGKSTMLRCINGLETITSGKIIVDGLQVGDPNVSIVKIRTEVGMVFQQFNLFPHMKVIDNIALGPKRVRKLSKDEAYTRANELLKRVGLPEKAYDYPGSLSGGQQQRVAIARALAMRPKVLLFDEPTSALDPELTIEVLDVIRDLAHTEKITIIIVTHEMAFAKDVADMAVMIDQGVIIEMGSPEEIFDNPKSIRAQAFLSKLITQSNQPENKK